MLYTICVYYFFPLKSLYQGELRCLKKGRIKREDKDAVRGVTPEGSSDSVLRCSGGTEGTDHSATKVPSKGNVVSLKGRIKRKRSFLKRKD